ncbi:MAG TPA: hypothetical protein VH880_08265 [Anaeromyxobacteraceae bacterium]|jgi:hypothetical protein
MIASPCPSELKQAIKLESRIEEQRSLFCARYDGCLDEAVEKGWTSWSCARCPLFASAGAAPRAA